MHDPGDDDRFDMKFARDPDPWRTRSLWYEARKRAVLVATLPRARYANAYEPGCANGELSALLAPRCDRLLASDASPRAIELARERLRAQSQVRLECMSAPGDWPVGRFDLVVLSEFGYYLADSALHDLVRRCRDTLADGGDVVACHWRHAADDFLRSGDEVHLELGRGLAMAAIAHHREADFALDVWSADPRSIAQREGLA